MDKFCQAIAILSQFSPIYTVLYMGMASAFGYIAQIPDGQIPEQIPQPMHLSASTTYSNPPSSGLLFREIAFSGQDLMHMWQSRQVPQLMQRLYSSLAAGRSQVWHFLK